MNNLIENNNCPTIQEIIDASKPGISFNIRNEIKNKINLCEHNKNDELTSLIFFLKDSNFDFDKLYNFLNSNFDTKAKLIKIRKNKISKTIYKSVTAAAVFISIVFLAVQIRNESLINKYILTEPGLPVFADLNGDKNFHEMMSAYRLNNIKLSLKYYYILTGLNNNDTLNYFGGWLYFKDNKLDSANLLFSGIHDSTSIYYQKSVYMRAITLYKIGERSESLKILKIIANKKDGEYYNNALMLINKKFLW